MPEPEQDLFTPPGVSYVEGVPFKNPYHEERSQDNNPEGKDLRVATAQWIKRYPLVSELFLRYCRQMAEKRRRFGISLITERVRWEIHLTTGEEYKLNNNHRAYIARWVIAKDPSIEPWLVFRKVRY